MRCLKCETAALVVSFCLTTSLCLAKTPLPFRCAAMEQTVAIDIEVPSRGKQSLVRMTTTTGSELQVEQSSGVGHYEFERTHFPVTINLDDQQVWVVEADCSVSER